MALDPDEILRVAALARLRLDAAEARRLAAELGRVLEHVDALAATPLEDVPEPTLAEPTPGHDDDARPDRLLRSPEELAPAWRDGFFTVPRLPAMDSDAADGGATPP